MIVNEIFYSIQGEGNWTGLSNVFIRTTGCNLRCSYCDTKYAYTEGKEINVNKIVEYIKRYPTNNVCITGGEPLLNKEIFNLTKILLEMKYKICIETNGSINIKKILKINPTLISLDIKCPSSNMDEKMFLENINQLRINDQLKFIIKNKKDYNYAKKIISKYNPICSIYFQTVWGIEEKILAEWILKDGLDVKLGIQVHKYIWGNKKGY